MARCWWSGRCASWSADRSPDMSIELWLLLDSCCCSSGELRDGALASVSDSDSDSRGSVRQRMSRVT